MKTPRYIVLFQGSLDRWWHPLYTDDELAEYNTEEGRVYVVADPSEDDMERVSKIKRQREVWVLKRTIRDKEKASLDLGVEIRNLRMKLKCLES